MTEGGIWKLPLLLNLATIALNWWRHPVGLAGVRSRIHFRSMTTESSSSTSPATEDRTVAILSYLTIIGFVVAIVLHSSKPTRLGAFHLRQMLGFIIAIIAFWVVFMVIAIIPVVNLLAIVLGPIGGLAFLVFWIIGLIGAIKGEAKPMPLVGEQFQSMLANTFK